jgi:hypothetical protein
MSYLGIPPYGQTIRSVTNITATASQTTFSIVGGYQIGYVDVFLNGVLLVPSVDYTATDNLTVVLTSGAAASDVFQALSYQPVAIVNVVKQTGDTMTGDLIFDTTGALTLPAGTEAQRPTGVAGMLRFNEDTDGFEGYDGTAWGSVGGGNTTALGLWENAATISADYTITAGNNAMSAGPITVDSGVTVTVPSGSTWTVV